MAYSLAQCRYIDLPRIRDDRGSLTFIEADNHIPFIIKRVYYLYDVHSGAVRGSHAHRNLQQLMIAVGGSFDVVLEDGTTTQRFHLNRPFFGLYICPMMWRTLENFSSGAVCMVMASEKYDEGDYIRDYDQFLATASQD